MTAETRIFNFRFLPAFVLAAVLFASPAFGAWSKEADIAGGWSFDYTRTVQVMALAGFERQLKENLYIRIEPTVEYMRSKDGQALFDGGATLVARLKSPMGKVTPFLDFGAGANGVSRKEFEGRELGGNFLFDLVMGVGAEFKNGLAVSYRYRHLSNGGLFKVNNGLDSGYVMVGYKF